MQNRSFSLLNVIAVRSLSLIVLYKSRRKCKLFHCSRLCESAERLLAATDNGSGSLYWSFDLAACACGRVFFFIDRPHQPPACGHRTATQHCYRHPHSVVGKDPDDLLLGYLENVVRRF
ncbi:hypothetical protein T07_7178 [Trichinella nelsoni]|uniref:Uncharacterized protein n=1 Tax=Trichinella nelsoni TaxID=6336 RepID=A0A0V0SE26_9BILA|nr:hypothetical protein T07_7178 [Trichinella nelsoni]